jgi:2-polyprenyl-6-hydroxyphenyl methylase/3-demethylubiquinone-9 3-methyltransferase
MSDTAPDLRFEFGANWSSFVEKAFTPERLVGAAASLRKMLGAETLEGRTFLVVGCGSGLFSLAACGLQASRVVSFDYDRQSVSASERLREQAGIPAAQWHIRQGSILDRAFLDQLEPADVVYSWGVLHHTGAMWTAIDNVCGLVRPGGQLAIAIYNRVDRLGDSSAMWWKIKRQYNRSPELIRRAMEGALWSRYAVREVVKGRNPFAAQANGGVSRGMERAHDIRDWLGGFPYEYATAGEVFNHVHGKHGLRLEFLYTGEGNLCNQFTFRCPEAD